MSRVVSLIERLEGAEIIRFLRAKAEFYNKQANEALDPSLRDERRHTADALEAICYELDEETK